MDYLLNYGITSDTIDEILKSLSEGQITDIILNKKEIIKSLNYLMSLNINCLNDILKYKTSFLYDPEKLIYIMETHPNLADCLKDDAFAFDEI